MKEKCKDLSMDEKKAAVEMMRLKKMRWVGDDFVFVAQ